MRYQERPGINPIFWLVKYPKGARQMVFLASQGNKIIQKHHTFNSFVPFWGNIFKQVVGRQPGLRWKPVKKYFGEIGLERPKKLFHNFTERSIGAIKKVWPWFA